MNQIQKVVLDSCVVIDLIEKPKVAARLKAGLRGKQVKFVICDVVLREVYKVRGFSPKKVVGAITRLLHRNVEVIRVQDKQKAAARGISSQFAICHNGDNKILSMCQANNFVLVTFDRMLLKTCQFLGVAGFHPERVGGI